EHRGASGLQPQHRQRPDDAADRHRPVLRVGPAARRWRLRHLALGGVRPLRRRHDHRQGRRRPRSQVRPRHRLRQDRRPHRGQGDHRHGVHRPLGGGGHLVVGHRRRAPAGVERHAAAALGAQGRRHPGCHERQDQDHAPGGRAVGAARAPAPWRRARRGLRLLAGPDRRGVVLPGPGRARRSGCDDPVVGLRVRPGRTATAFLARL
ncbi:MAG: CDP-diacylglycerol--glycerol-3-phosphate 3-phosphatidyltransferase, partial [uncultured Nocardioides sp.]